MSEVAQRSVPEPGEVVYRTRPSWAPAFFALGAALAICGTFTSFMVPGWIYSLIGVIVVLAFLRSMVRGGIRHYFQLPRRQRVRGAVLPVETLSPPRR